jgi:metal-dependent amidase/aminoacylase/carboxypeptidase family protein
MPRTGVTQTDTVLGGLDGILPALRDVHRDSHAHPEPSMQEQRTADLAATSLHRAGYDVTTAVGGTGVVGLLGNGQGPTVMLRADMDALPVKDATGLPYASARGPPADPGKVIVTPA